MSCTDANDATATTITGKNAAATICRIVTNGSHPDAEKLHESDIATTLNQQHYQLQHHHPTLRQQQKL